MKKAEQERYAARVRAVVPVYEHEDCYRIARALEMYATLLTELDRSYPDPDRRADAAAMQALAKEFLRINQARRFVQEKVYE